MGGNRYRPKTMEQAIAHVVEEAGEVIAAYGKAKRFGWDSTNPEVESDETNAQWFRRELHDLKKSIEVFEALEAQKGS